jgi:hypothetical protein
MLRLLKVAVLLGLIGALLVLLPFGGRTLFDRWRSARGVSDFATRTWAEMRGVAPAPAPGSTASPRKARPGKPAAGAEPAPARDEPLETTTEDERRSLDRLLDQHLSEKPKR